MNAMTNEQFIAQLSDHPAEHWMADFVRLFDPSDIRLLRTFSGSERKTIWELMDQYIREHGRVTAYLEIGVNCGASMWMMYPFMEHLGKMIGVDLNGDPKDERVLMRDAVTQQLEAWLMDCMIIEGDSKKRRDAVKPCGPYDVLLIDGDHSYEGVKADWDNYMPMVLPGGLVILHDIENPRFGVGRLWQERRGELMVSYSSGNVGWGTK
jgi:hypothetical protein